jgi:transcriptional regulator with XRE-family HTH domain
LNWTVRDVAEKAGVHRNTVSNAEAQRYAGASGTLNPIQRAIEKAGVDFTKIGQPGVKLR